MTIENLSGISKLCTGCLSCINICPQNAISTKCKEDGFYHPYIDKSYCIDCGLCVKACPINTPIEKTQRLKVFSVAAKDPILKAMGSSGGVFPLLATEMSKKGGVVYGVAFSRERLAYHTSSDNVKLSSLFRSKYIQSDIGLTYRDVENDLLSLREVMFVGTPCQVRGLKCYLKERRIEDNNLITIDFMCHGVPSPKYFDDFLARMEKSEKSPIKEVTFREKELGWRKQVTNFYLENNNKVQYLSKNFFYYFFFSQNYTLRDSCYNCCEFSNHVSDITIADHWTIEKSLDDDCGRSLVVVHTEKGQQNLHSIMGMCESCVVEDGQYNEKIYSHHKYDMRLKKRWISAYIKRGEKYTSETFFKKERIRHRFQSIFNQILHCVKKIIKTLLKM